MNHPNAPYDQPPATSPATNLSPRRRRLRWTVAILVSTILAGSAAGIVLHLNNRPAPYRPDETSTDITAVLLRNLPSDAPRPHFADVTSEAGLSAFRSFAGGRTSQLPEDMGPGAAWGDFDNDGDDDLFIVSAGGPLGTPSGQLAPSVLYENLGDGTFRKVEGFPETRIHGMAAAWGDYDGDGFLDLIVTGYNTLLLFRNEGGTGKFTRDTRFPELEGFWAGASWGDFNNNRHLDLYVCGYVQYEENEDDRARGSDQLGTSVPYTLNPASYEPARNLFFRNNGDGTFTEMAEALGVDNPTGRSLVALWHDFDDDGWLDLYVANDISDNVFYRNTGGGFEDISHAAWVADYRSAMGLAAGDYNRDGDDDLFITHWVAQENSLYDNLWADLKRNPRQQTNSPTAGNSESRTPPRLRFMDVNEARGLGQVSIPYVGWGTEFADFDGDGWLDLIVANGHTLESDGPMPRKLRPQESFLFWNQRGEFFHNIAFLNTALSEPRVSRGLALSDYDNDGDLDVLLVQLDGGVQLLRNDMQTGNWLQVQLRSRLANGAPLGFGDGAKVIAHLGEVTLRRTVSSVSYLSQSSRAQHFGLGSVRRVDKLEVRWLGGATNFFTNLDANAVWQLTEDDPEPRRIQISPARSNERTAAPASPAPLSTAKPLNERTRVVEFWKRQRAAMDAMIVEKDIPKAMALFEAALDLDPNHQDSRYYLGNCFALSGDSERALEQLSELTRINPRSHRGHSQWGALRAISAQSDADLAAAEASYETAYKLNPEETGALLALGEIALLRGDAAKARAHLFNACRSNPRAVGGFFLQGYLAWQRGDAAEARELLEQAREALGQEWQPKGSTSEGDVTQKWHIENSPLTRFWEEWDGRPDPATAFIHLNAHLAVKEDL
jgi:enediyne biosynthesis protein E4